MALSAVSRFNQWFARGVDVPTNSLPLCATLRREDSITSFSDSENFPVVPLWVWPTKLVTMVREGLQRNGLYVGLLTPCNAHSKSCAYLDLRTDTTENMSKTIEALDMRESDVHCKEHTTRRGQPAKTSDYYTTHCREKFHAARGAHSHFYFSLPAE